MFLYPVTLPAHSGFSCGDCAISFIAAICFSEVQRSSSLEILQSHCCNISPSSSSDSRGCSHSGTANISRKSNSSSPRTSCVPKRFLSPHPQQPAHRTHPTSPFGFGSLATTMLVFKLEFSYDPAGAAFFRLTSDRRQRNWDLLPIHMSLIVFHVSNILQHCAWDVEEWHFSLSLSHTHTHTRVISLSLHCSFFLSFFLSSLALAAPPPLSLSLLFFYSVIAYSSLQQLAAGAPIDKTRHPHKFLEANADESIIWAFILCLGAGRRSD
jgi:hypothetical protein